MAKASAEYRSDVLTGADRRKSGRTDYVVRVEYSTVDALFSDFARNINEGGLYVESETPHPVGTDVSLQFRIPGIDDPIQVNGRVVWSNAPDEPGDPGMGIEFGDLDPLSRDRINTLIRQLRADPRNHD